MQVYIWAHRERGILVSQNPPRGREPFYVRQVPRDLFKGANFLGSKQVDGARHLPFHSLRLFGVTYGETPPVCVQSK